MAPRIEVRPSAISYPLGEDVGHIELLLDHIRFVTPHVDDYQIPFSVDVSLKTPNERAEFRFILDRLLEHIEGMDE
jgi:hypothetical protein